MKNELQTVKPTSLETASDIHECLNWKIAQLNKEEKCVSTGLADYFYIAVENLEQQLRQLKQLEAEIKSRKREITEQTAAIKREGASFLTGQGIDRLDGVLSSSVTVTPGKEATVKQRFKTSLTKKEIEQLIIDSGFGYMEEVESPGMPDTLKINKRKVHLAEVEE